jgi:Nickel uptake substrate-specific transmembrane region.
MKTLLITFLLNFILLSASAHAVFIDTSLKGEKGKSHTVKVVYGEPDEHEALSKWWWYKEGMSVSLTLIKPDGSTASLPTTAQGDHLLATFTPNQEGVYHLSLKINTDRREGAKTQYQINAIASIQVGNQSIGNTPENLDNELFVFAQQVSFQNKKEVALTLYQKGKPASNASIQIIAPSGWIKWLETDESGVVKFTPEWKGKYFAEVSKKEKAEGQAFEEYSRASSMSFAVK